jgi:hypothetical protein
MLEASVRHDAKDKARTVVRAALVLTHAGRWRLRRADGRCQPHV